MLREGKVVQFPYQNKEEAKKPEEGLVLSSEQKALSRALLSDIKQAVSRGEGVDSVSVELDELRGLLGETGQFPERLNQLNELAVRTKRGQGSAQELNQAIEDLQEWFVDFRSELDNVQVEINYIKPKESRGERSEDGEQVA